MQKISQLLIVLLLAVFPTGELLRIKIYENVYITPQDFIVFILFILVAYKFVTDKIKPKFADFFMLQLIFISLGVLSLVINCFFNTEYNFQVSLLYAIRYLMYLCILFYPLLIGNKLNVNNLIFLSGGAVVLIGIPQFFFYNNLRNLFYLGWDDHLYRLFSTFLDPNFVGLFYVLYLGLLIGRIFKKGWNKAYFEVIFMFLTFISIYLTYSRSALIALFTFVISLSLLCKKIKLIFFALPILIFFIFVFSDFGTEGLNPLRTASSRDRIMSISNAGVIIKDNFIYGVGFNSFRYAQLKYGLRNEWGAALSNADAGTDNGLLFVFATTGIIGLIVFIISYYRMFKNLYEEKTYESKVCIASLLALFSGGFFINSLFYIPIMTFILLVLAFKSSKS